MATFRFPWCLTQLDLCLSRQLVSTPLQRSRAMMCTHGNISSEASHVALAVSNVQPHSARSFECGASQTPPSENRTRRGDGVNAQNILKNESKKFASEASIFSKRHRWFGDTCGFPRRRPATNTMKNIEDRFKFRN